jgi:hypothetical protein
MQCKAKTQNGQPCRAQALKSNDYCFTHDPASGAERARARKKGGENRHTPHAGNSEGVNKSPRSIADTFSILDYTLIETLAMDNSIQRGRLLVSIAAAYVDALKVGEIETRLNELLSILQAREAIT